MSPKSYRENEKLRNIGVALATRAPSHGRAAYQGRFSPSLGLNPAANKSMESLQILQWCQEIDLPRPATNEGLEMYKEASRYLQNKDAQIEIPKWSALQVRMQELQREYGALQDRQDLTPEECELRRTEIKAQWARLKPEYDNLGLRLMSKRDQFVLCKAYRKTSQQRKATLEAAEFASMEMQTRSLEATRVGAALQPTTNEVGQQQLGTPDSLPLSLEPHTDQSTGSPHNP